MEYADLQKFFKEASSGTARWLSDLQTEVQADAAAQARLEEAMRLFALYGPRAEEEAYYAADKRLRDYEGTDFVLRHRTTIEGVYVSAAYSKLAMSIALLLSSSRTAD
jgi:hypothetical protein